MMSSRTLLLDALTKPQPKPTGLHAEWDYMEVPIYVSQGSSTLVQSILKALGRGLLELGLQDIHRKVKNDYGEVTDRSISRHLETLVRHGDVIRLGDNVPYLYKRARK